MGNNIGKSLMMWPVKDSKENKTNLKEEDD